MKFIIDGIEWQDYQLSNEQIKRLIDEGNISDDEKNFLLGKVYDRFTSTMCARDGETKDELFARLFGDFVNGKIRDKRRVAELMANDHRYLQQEMFKVFIEYVKVLSKKYEDGYYDGRNEWSAETANRIENLLKDDGWSI